MSFTLPALFPEAICLAKASVCFFPSSVSTKASPKVVFPGTAPSSLSLSVRLRSMASLAVTFPANLAKSVIALLLAFMASEYSSTFFCASSNFAFSSITAATIDPRATTIAPAIEPISGIAIEAASKYGIMSFAIFAIGPSPMPSIIAPIIAPPAAIPAPPVIFPMAALYRSLTLSLGFGLPSSSKSCIAAFLADAAGAKNCCFASPVTGLAFPS